MENIKRNHSKCSLIHLSSLGTNCALKDFSNVTTQDLGQNGYCKFPNGLLIQWGKVSGSSVVSYTITMSTSFFDKSYKIFLQQFTSLHLTVVFIPHHLLMIQLKQLADFVLIEITPLEGVLDYHKKLLIGLLLGVGNYEINYNIEIRMYNFSRKLVVFFIIVFAQSSLGTKSAQIKEQNLGQNGYRKYEDGLLIQWGHLTNSSAGSATIWFPISFHDASYQFVTTMETVSNEHTLYTALPYNKSASYVDVMRKFLLADNSITVGSSTRSFDWIAIGR
jgi:hypothetical protein